MNAATLIIALIVAALLALVIVKMVRDKKAGRTSCGCSCDGCHMCDDNAYEEFKRFEKQRKDK